MLGEDDSLGKLCHLRKVYRKLGYIVFRDGEDKHDNKTQVARKYKSV